MMRRVLGVKRQEWEGHQGHMIRTGLQIQRLFDRDGLRRAPERALQATYRWAGAATSDVEPGGDGLPSIVQLLYRYRSRDWWEQVQRSEKLRKRTRGADQDRLRHADKGKRVAHEDLLCECFGLQWRMLAVAEDLWRT